MIDNDLDAESDALSELKILQMMTAPSYIMACYLSAIDNLDTMNQNVDGINKCYCATNITENGFHFCPANKQFVPRSLCRQHAECNDPIYTCFDLAKLSSDLVARMPEYSEEFNEISKAAMAFSVRLLDQCLNADELDVLLKENMGSKKYFRLLSRNQFQAEMKYPRLMLAIELNNKEFVGHMYCQQMLKQEWYCGVTWTGTSFLYKVIQISSWFFLLYQQFYKN